MTFKNAFSWHNFIGLMSFLRWKCLVCSCVRVRVCMYALVYVCVSTYACVCVQPKVHVLKLVRLFLPISSHELCIKHNLWLCPNCSFFVLLADVNSHHNPCNYWLVAYASGMIITHLSDCTSHGWRAWEGHIARDSHTSRPMCQQQHK